MRNASQYKNSHMARVEFRMASSTGILDYSDFFGTLPFASTLSANSRSRLSGDWKKSGIAFSLEAFINICFISSFILSASIFCILIFFGIELAESFAISIIALSLFLLFSLRMPKILSVRHAAEIESDLPMALRELALHLRIKTPFEKALISVSKSGYRSSLIFGEASSAIASGTPVQSALLAASETVASLLFSRAMGQLSVIYEEGGDPHAIISLADELASVQSSKAREFGSRAAFFGLIYVATSALLPSFFLVASIGAAPLGASFATPSSVLLFYLVVAPILDIAVLILIHISAPPSADAPNANAEGELIDSLCRNANLPSMRKLHLPLTLLSAIVGLSSAALLSFSPFGILFGMTIAAIPSMLLGYFSHLASSRISQIENSLPSALLAASSQPRSFSLEKSLALMAKSSSGPLSDEISSLSRQIAAGAQIQKALSDAASSTPSHLWSRCLTLLNVGYKTGANMQHALRSTSDDILLVFSLLRERAAASAIQRYTLIGAAILVPLILATVLSFSTSLAEAYSSTSSALSLGGASPEEIAEVASVAAPSCQVYILIYSVITAFFLSLAEGRRERLFFYCASLALLTQIVWLLARGA